MYSGSTSTIQSAGPSSHSPPETKGTESEPMHVYYCCKSFFQVLVIDSGEVHKGRVEVTVGVTHILFQLVVSTSCFTGAACWRENVGVEATLDTSFDKGPTKGFSAIRKWLS